MHSSVPPQIPGTLVPQEAAQYLRKDVANLLNRENTRFPGAQPVSFAREHIEELHQQEYFMCEKTDGIRCLLFLHFIETPHGFEPATFLIDRKNNYYDIQPPLRFPYYKFPNDNDKFLFGTLLDGELVNDRDQDPQTKEWRTRLIFYVFDCLAVDGQNFTSRSLDKRIGYMQGQVFKPWANWVRTHGMPLGHPEPFRVKEKQMHPPYSLNFMFEQILPNLPHGNDGLVFTCKSTPYQFGTDPHILKWKPPHENTIDFKLRLGEFPLFDPEDGEEGLIPDYDARPDKLELLVFHGGNDYRVFTELYYTDADWEILKSLNQRLDGRIIECYRDDAGRWRFKPEDDGTPRWRDDKKDANHISTVKSVLESIADPVTEQDLLSVQQSVRDAVKKMQREDEERRRAKEMEFKERELKKRKLSEMVAAEEAEEQARRRSAGGRSLSGSVSGSVSGPLS